MNLQCSEKAIINIGIGMLVLKTVIIKWFVSKDP